MTDILLVLLIGLQVVGVFLIYRWIASLNGTVKAQKDTLEALGGLNKTALEVIKAMDPERWAKEVKIHKELADKKAEAVVEEERRKLRAEQGAELERGAAAINRLLELYEDLIRFSIALVPYIPKARRLDAFREDRPPDRLSKTFFDWAEKAPDLSSGPLDFASFAQAIMGSYEVPTRIQPPQPSDVDLLQSGGPGE